MMERVEYAEARLAIAKVLMRSGLTRSEELALLTEMAARTARRAMRPPKETTP